MRRFSYDEDPNAFKPWSIGWECSLLHNEDNVPTARRFAERFYPDQIDVVEATSERATQRARLAMGPQRKDQAPSMA